MSTKIIIDQTHSESSLPYWKLITFIGLVTIIMISMAMDKDIYLADQKDIFLITNEALQTIPNIVWLNITYLGDALILIPLISFVSIINTRIWAAMFGAIPLAFSLSHLGKNFFAIPRPAAVLDSQQFHIIGERLTAFTSFPSGHTITIFAAASAILFVVLAKRKNSPNAQIRSFGIILILAVATIVGISRVAVGAHWPADVVFGAVLGVISGMSGEYLSRRYIKWWSWMNDYPVYLSVFIFMFSFILIVCSVNGLVHSLFVTRLAIAISATTGTYITLKSILLNENRNPL